ncbi:M1 family metallopeptidase [Fulvivirga sp. M361]|uniref:M1 family metallopeptidase n=1 Tax=Fulvivirga sp. M361 TaxID=2594266 RepID=UPI001179953B|nr:M1 family metallopeptidase [Fulvivirga sp. M361]TRX60854.1 M1 family metallopeptidase [Fulvivirga sp. M361]
MNKYLLSLLLYSALLYAHAQPTSTTYWQQHVDYKMEIKVDVKTHQFEGSQKLTYTNNSPDTLTKVYYHLYFNAFQPGSMMDVRSLNIEDPDRRVGSRISKLSDSEIGYQHVTSLKQNGNTVSHHTEGTILEVMLNKPILPGQKATFDMEFNGQVPLQVRRTGRDNAEGISYSMSQWYPKMTEYDYLGWHANPYIAREFHGVWGNFDVKITIDPTYTVAGTGYLQNANEIGHGYEKKGSKIKSTDKPLTWHFKAPNVIDFMWAADPDYEHTTAQVPNGPMLHFFYQKNQQTEENWSKLPEKMVQAMQFMSTNFGQYPYDQYSFIQGGDGGMEYPMATLITGNRKFQSLVGVSVHELIHSWFQGVLATNESLFPWMDEGFTSYASSITMQHLFYPKNDKNPHLGSQGSYLLMASSGLEEPLTTHSDHYKTNRAYGVNAYSKGAIFLDQLSYIIGHETFMKGMRRYYNTWKFKHPTSIDFIRIMEKTSGIELDWYLEHFAYTTKQLDYGIKSVIGQGDATFVTLERLGEMIMPIDLYIEYMDGSKEIIYVPLRIMRGFKNVEDTKVERITKESWPWTYPSYTLKIKHPASKIKSLEIDSSLRMADIDRSNNTFRLNEHVQEFKDPTK